MTARTRRHSRITQQTQLLQLWRGGGGGSGRGGAVVVAAVVRLCSGAVCVVQWWWWWCRRHIGRVAGAEQSVPRPTARWNGGTTDGNPQSDAVGRQQTGRGGWDSWGASVTRHNMTADADTGRFCNRHASPVDD